MVETSTLKKVVMSSTFATGIVLASPLIVDAALGDNTLRQGMTHSDVKELQDALTQKGYFTFDRSTGYYGTITTDAVRRFQQENHLQVDGIAGPQTLGALLAKMGGQAQATNFAPASTSSLSVTGLLRLGSSGTEVELLQEKLKEHGTYSGSITGQFGQQTDTAVRDYQRANNLKVDGIVGPQTITHLLGKTPSAVHTIKNNEQTASAAVTSTLLRVGSSGAAVTDLQAKLRSVGLLDLEPTGYFGQETDSSVRAFQRVHNLTADGVAGSKTLAKLNEVATNQPTKPATNTTTNTKTTQTQASRSGSGNAALVTNLVSEAATLIGTPYLYGGTTTKGFDCSGFIQFVFNKQGIQVPRTALQQWNAGRTVSQPAVGDLVFFETYQPGPSHNGIYIGNNQFVHSGSSTGVTISSMNNSYWSQRYLGAKRLH